MTRLKTSSGQFGLIGGICRATSDCILIREPSPVSSAARWKGYLYILAEPATEGSRGYQVAREAIVEIADTYYECTSPSITTCLARAMLAANKTLFEHNMQVSGHEKITLGVTCAVMRGDELLVAQVLPGQVYVVHQGQIRAFPLNPSWDPEAATLPTAARIMALGWSEEITPEFFHSPLTSGDVFCLCTSNIGRFLGQKEAEQVLLYQEPGNVVEQLYRRVHQQGFSEAHAVVAELQPAVARATTPLFSVAGVRERTKLVGDSVRSAGTFFAGEVRRMLKPKPRPPRVPKPRLRAKPAIELAPEIPQLARPKPTGPWYKTAGQWIQDLIHPKKEMPKLERPRMRTTAPPPKKGRVAPAILGLAALIVLASLVFIIRAEIQRREESNLTMAIEQAKQRVQSAATAKTLKDANDLMDDAERLLTGAVPPGRSIPRIDYELSNLRQERDRLNGITRFGDLTLVVDINTFSTTVAAAGEGACHEACSFRDLVVSGDSIYLLEEEKGTVYLFSPATSAITPVLWEGMKVQDRPVGRIIAITLLDRPKDCAAGASGESWLAAVDADRQLLLQHSGQWEVYSLYSDASWTQQSIDLEGYQGNIYVLKGEAAQILKYYCNAYEMAPNGWLADPMGARIQDGVDMAIDGSIYLLLKDGTVEVMRQGELEKAYPYDGYKGRIWPETLFPTQLYTDPASSYYYIVDRYIGRILQMRKDTEQPLVRDLRGPEDTDLQDLRAVVVRENQGLFYMIAGAGLYRGSVAAPAGQPSPTPITLPTPKP